MTVGNRKFSMGVKIRYVALRDKLQISLPKFSRQCCSGDDEASPTTSVARDTDIPECDRRASAFLTEGISTSDLESSGFAHEKFVTEKKQVLD